MPAKGKVSIVWQIVFAIISPLNIWAFYRIKKLRLFVLYVIIPSVVISSIVFAVTNYELNNPQRGFDEEGNRFPEPTVPPHMTPIQPHIGKFNTGTYLILSIIASIGLTIFSVYLVVKWSRQWNEQFNSNDDQLYR